MFSEPLAPIGVTVAGENRALAQALTAYSQRTNTDDFEALTRFLDDHPTSPWRASLLTELGVGYRHTGWFSKALACWEEAWGRAKGETNTITKIIGDQAVAELLELNARLGRSDRLEALFSDLQGRELHPAFSEKIRNVRAGLWLMRNRPEQAFRCGPMALGQIWGSHLSPEVFGEKILQSRSTPQGISLDSVCQLANELGMNYQMAHREPGSAFIVPAVIHWKVGHYASLLKQEGGQYFIDDPTFGEGIWMSEAALDAEASGYFLVPAGILPTGWTSVGTDEGKTIWGKGTTQASDPSRTRPSDEKTCPDQGTPMAQYAFHLMLASLNIIDTPVGYSPPRGPAVLFKVTYTQRDAGPPFGQPATFTYSNMGQKWTFDWLSYITDDPQNPQNAAYCYLQGGGYEPYTSFNTTNQSYASQLDSHTILVRTSSTNYERDFPDGSKQLFTLPDGSVAYPRKIFLTKVIDPYSNSLTFTYDGTFRLVAATDALGQASTVSYGLTNDVLKITKVTDPFGRYATFQYDSSGGLTNITDILGITSGFTYSNTFITSLTTPYGTTTFATGGDVLDSRNSWLQATDPLGQTERAFFVNDVSIEPGCDISISDPSALVPTGLNLTDDHLFYRNTFYWDKKAMQLYPGDYAKAKIYHWLHSTDINTCTGTLESTKDPLEARVWRTYAGQTDSFKVGTNGSPAALARVLDNGSSQIYRFQYNNFGRVLQTTDPTNRVTIYTYATNQLDLIAVAQQVGANTQILGQFVYNAQHLPVIAVDAAGQTNFVGYNSFGQMTALTNALNQVTALAYDTNGYLTNIIGAMPGATLSFTYDSYGRLRTVTDSDGFTITSDYDAADRLTKASYSDGTYEQVAYNRLDAILVRDRRGHWTSNLYDPLRRLTDTVDALGRRTHFEWCGCGGIASISDPLGRVTTWVRDLQGRVTAKVFPDNTQVVYGYETNSSRLKSITDAKNQISQYSYYIDNNVQQVTYSNVVVFTPMVSFTYDTNYNRLLTMVDGTGTTTYSYYAITNGQLGAGKLQSVQPPLNNAMIAYYYDALGRMTNRAINGVAQSVTFDALGRGILLTNALGTFTNTYVGATARLAESDFPNNQRTTFGYFGTTNNSRLQQILNVLVVYGNLQIISAFNYGYYPGGQISTWTKQADLNVPTVLSMAYDSADELLSAILTTNTVGGTMLAQNVYGYDLAGNRTGEEIQNGTNNPPAITGGSFNTLNQLTNLTGSGGPMLFSGTLDKLGTVSVNGNPAIVNFSTSNFVGYATVGSGTNVVPIVATDSYGNSRTNRYQIVVGTNTVTKTLGFDLNGNEISVVSASSTNTYEWDAANRLTAINSGTNRSEFTCDGLGHRVQIVEKQNGVAVKTNKFLWCGVELCEERDSTGGTVTKRFFGQGEQISGTNYFFTRDHLGSVREMIDSSGTIRARYDYDPYGRRTKISGDLEADFAFTGHYYHPTSGLFLTLYRAYDSDLGRWLNRDPIAEQGGINLFAYVRNSPINRVDPFGLAANEVYGPNGYPVGPSSLYAPGGALYVPGSLPPMPLPGYFFAGAVVGMAGAAAVGALATALVGIGVSEPVVAGGLLVTGAAGYVGTGISIAKNPCPKNIAFNLGSLGGAGLMGAFSGGPIASALSPRAYQPRGPVSLAADVSMAWRGPNGNISPIAFLADWLFPGAQVGPMSTGPSTIGAALTITGAGAGSAAGSQLLFGTPQ